MSPQRLKLTLIVGALVSAALTLLSWTQEWFALVLADDRPLSIAGQQAVPGLSALALASLALTGALAIAALRVRVVLGVVQALIGAAVVVVAVGAVAAPITASASAITDATAVSGPESIAALVLSLSFGPWPWVAIVAGLGALAVGVAVVVTARRWPGATRRYETAKADVGTAGAWDSLSRGDDPT